MLSKGDILSREDLTRELVDVPEWDGQVYVRTMTGAERDAFEMALSNGGTGRVTMTNIRARLAALTVCDEKGKRLFEEGDAAALGGKSAAALDRIFAVAQRLNKIGADDVKALEKNS